MKTTGMSKKQLLEHIDNQFRLARISRDNGNEKAQKAVEKLLIIMNTARKIKDKNELVLYMINERLLIAA